MLPLTVVDSDNKKQFTATRERRRLTASTSPKVRPAAILASARCESRMRMQGEVTMSCEAQESSEQQETKQAKSGMGQKKQQIRIEKSEENTNKTKR